MEKNSFVRVTYRKGQTPRRTKEQEMRRQALMMIEEEVDKWVMKCKPENRAEVKKRVLQRMLNHDYF